MHKPWANQIHNLHTIVRTWKETTTFFPIVYYVINGGDYIKVAKIPKYFS